jgi:hypothetical protein
MTPRVLSLIPPMTQLNTPYPSTAYLTGFLRSRGIAAVQEDLALALVLRLFSAPGLQAIREVAEVLPVKHRTPRVAAFLARFEDYRASIEPLPWPSSRGAIPRLRTASPAVPSCPRARASPRSTCMSIEEGGDPLAWAFGALGVTDRARHFATLYLDDIADVLREAVDPRFEFVRYAESLAQSQASFEPLAQALAAPENLIDATLRELALAAVARHAPEVVLLSAPFPGNVYGAFRIAQAIKARHPEIVTVLGGGFVNTELRELAEPRVFDFFDYVMLDDGERPLLALLEHLRGERPRQQLVRCFLRADGAVQFINAAAPEVPFAEAGTPTWDGLPLDRYLSLLDMLNPMHRLWSDARWNKLTVAHGCYWKKCSFCDVSLDYIARYEAAAATTLVDRIEAIVAETGQTASISSTRRRRRRRSRPWPTNCASVGGRSPGGATSASKNPSLRICALIWRPAAASPSPAAWRWPPTACSS